MSKHPVPWQWKLERDPGGHWATASVLDANGRVMLQGAPGITADELEAIVVLAGSWHPLLEALKQALHRERQLAGVIGAACTGAAHEAAAALVRRIEGEPSVSSSSTPSVTPT
jgi:hypothetical protein